MARPARRLGEQATDAVQDTAHHLLRRADGQVERLSGAPLEAWASRARHAVEDRPLVALGAAVAAGYVLGKLFWRRRRA